MTGMGRVRGRVGDSYLFAEIKSVNHRYCEVSVRMPVRYQMFELGIVTHIKKQINRGKVDITFFEDRGNSDVGYNVRSLKAYYRFLLSIKQDLKIAEPISLAHIQAGMPYWMTKDADVENLWPEMKKLVDQAIQRMMAMRVKEGRGLRNKLAKRLDIVDRIRLSVLRDRSIIETLVKERFAKRIEKILGDVEVDQDKLANEVAYYLDKCDVTEELDRLESHIKQMRDHLKASAPSGRSLDFLIQEMNREWNTIGSKAQNTKVATAVIRAKTEMEKIREQVQNIE